MHQSLQILQCSFGDADLCCSASTWAREFEGALSIGGGQGALSIGDGIGAILPRDTPLDEDETELPFFMEVELSAGNGSTQVIEKKGAKLRFSKSTLRRVGVQPQNAACVTVSGNSMETS